MSFKVAEYSQTVAGLAELSNKYLGVNYPVNTPKGMTEAKEARSVIKKIRTDLEKKRKEIKAPALDYCRLIDDEAKAITEELLKLESPIDEQIKAEEKRKEEEKVAKAVAEKSRVDAIKAVIAQIEKAVIDNMNQPSTVIRSTVVGLSSWNVDYDFMEFKSDADLARTNALEKLEQMAIEAEQREAQAAETARQLAEYEAMKKAEAERIANEAKAQAEREAKERAEREAFEAKVKAEADAKQAAIDAENARLAQIERERIAVEQAEIAKQQAEIARQQKEIDDAKAAQEAKERAEREYLADWCLAILQYETWCENKAFELAKSEKSKAETDLFLSLNLYEIEQGFLTNNLSLRGALIEAYLKGKED